MWLIMRGALGDKVRSSPFYHIPARTPRSARWCCSRPRMKIASRRRRRVRRKASRRPQEHRRGRDRLGQIGRTPSATRRSPQVRRAHSGTELAEALAQPDVDAVILCTPTQMHAEQAIACMDAGKHVQVEIPLSDSWADAEAVLGEAAGDRARLHGRPHPPLQPEPPVRPQQDRRRRARGPADGRADLLLPPQEHERQGRGAQLDRPPAVAPRRAHDRPVRLPGGQDRHRQRASRGRSIPSSASRWTCRSS